MAIRWNVLEDSLPPEVREAALLAGEKPGPLLWPAEGGPWRLLRESNSRLIWRFEAPGGSAWLVKRIRGGVRAGIARWRGRPSEAVEEFDVARRAIRAGLPMIPFRFLAERQGFGRPCAVLASEFAEGARDLASAVRQAWNDPSETGRLLGGVRDVALGLREAGWAHRDFSGSNILATPEGDFWLVDWLKAGNVFEHDRDHAFRSDLARIASDLRFEGGVPGERLADFLAECFERAGFDGPEGSRLAAKALESASKRRRNIAKRASENALKKSRAFDCFDLRGWKVRAFKPADRGVIAASLGEATPLGPLAEKEALQAWAAACAMEKIGVGGHGIAALATRRAGMFGPLQARLIPAPAEGFRPLAEALRAPETRETARNAAVRFLRLLRECKLSPQSFDPADWLFAPGSDEGPPRIRAARPGLVGFVQGGAFELAFPSDGAGALDAEDLEAFKRLEARGPKALFPAKKRKRGER